MRGSYLLLMELKNTETIPVGKLGKIDFKKSLYIYVGSALNGLDQRIQRHLRKQKKMHWHIDYLINHAKIVNVFYKKNNIRKECFIAKTLKRELSSIPGFGCSDCLCKSHLFYGSYEETKNAISNLEMKQYLINAKSYNCL
ncbi:MAG: GIY-YIG nuclease family protein [Thermoplasmatales archaeon]|nr:MAG: GIY-YIG nuclease family protein [Thermoplasmatales archaeon]